ncbi:MAG: hypothetical protein RIS70_3695 [Planctomycetota bacterium]
MKTTCLVNSYNYAAYVIEAIDSALNQRVPFDEIIVVDDGSTDGTPDLLKKRYGHVPSVQIVTKSNGGQLSCFNEGIRRAIGDIVFFLDADDIYGPDYTAEVLATYSRVPDTDCVFTGMHRFGQLNDIQLPSSRDVDCGYSTISRCFGSDEWIGAPTSALSLRRATLECFLPYPLESDWRTRADDVLVYGCDFAGGKKYYLAQPLVHYRIHSHNHFHGKLFTANENYQRRLRLSRLFGWLNNKMAYDTDRLLAYAAHEFTTRPAPTFKRFLEYRSILRRGTLRSSTRRRALTRMLGHYLSTNFPSIGRLIDRTRAARHARRHRALGLQPESPVVASPATPFMPSTQASRPRTNAA